MDHLTSLDAMLLHRDVPTEPRQVATLALLAPGHVPLDHDRLLKVIADRIDMVPRYRQVPHSAPAGLGMPIWVDDENFDLSLHVRRSAVPAPGGRDALNDLVGRLVARRLDHDRPLWELYVIEGLASGELALLFKAHQALIDGSHTVDLAQVLLEETPRDRDLPHEAWTARHLPGPLELAISAITEQVESPGYLWDNLRYHVEKVAGAVPIRGSEPPPGPLSGRLSRHRRFAQVALPLGRFRDVRSRHGGTVNDVILAVIAGGLRGWLLTRAEQLGVHVSFRAMVPMSIADVDSKSSMPTSYGSRVLGHLLSLPVGEPNAVVRLHQISYALKGHRETGVAVAANRLAALPGFATSTFHAVGARVAEGDSGKPYHVLITNVPGPPEPVYMAGQQLSEVYPALPLTGHRMLSIGVTSYNGRVFFGLVGDRESCPDLDVLAQCIRDALDELGDSSSAVGRAPRGGDVSQRMEQP